MREQTCRRARKLPVRSHRKPRWGTGRRGEGPLAMRGRRGLQVTGTERPRVDGSRATAGGRGPREHHCAAAPRCGEGGQGTSSMARGRGVPRCPLARSPAPCTTRHCARAAWALGHPRPSRGSAGGRLWAEEASWRCRGSLGNGDRVRDTRLLTNESGIS